MLLYIHLKYDIFLYQLFVVFSLSLPLVKNTVSRLCSLLYRKKQAKKGLLHRKMQQPYFFILHLSDDKVFYICRKDI